MKSFLFKSRQPFLQVACGDFGMIVFRNHKLLVADKEQAEYIKKNLVNDKAMGIFVDPDEHEVDQVVPNSDAELRAQQLQEFVTKQNQKLEPSAYDASKVSPASSAETSGKAMTAPHFTGADSAALLRATLANKTAGG